MKNKKVEKKRMKSPYWFVITIGLFLSITILAAAVKTSIIDAPKWNEKAAGIWRLGEESDAMPARGDILAHDGTPLAQTVALYTAYIDFRDPRIDMKLYRDTVFPHGGGVDTLNLDTLCSYLAKKFPVKTKREYYDYISKKRDRKSSSCILAENITDLQYQELKGCPIFKKKRNGRSLGLTRNRCYKRFYPYDTLTSVVLGRAMLATEQMLDSNPSYKRNEWHGSSGMELKLDTLLFGRYGTVQRRQEHLGYGMYEVVAPVKGYDVVTTLDMAMQDIAQRNLMHMVKSQRADYGTAVIMEVSTGEIRAMANVERNKDGKYTFNTRRNYAITAIEPGSVVKPLSLLMAMENGNIDPMREFNSEGAIPEIGGYKKIGHYKNPITAQEVIIKSDNRGVCKLVGDVYRGRYNDFVEDIEKSGIMETADLPLPGAQRPRLTKNMEFKKRWQYFAYAQMIFGYYNRYAPVSTLAVYNAIANDGRMMKPQLVKALRREGEPDIVYEPECVNEHFCTPLHARQMREMLHGVVNSDIGTAKIIRDGRVEIAGKTGTAKAQIERVVINSKGLPEYRESYYEGMWRLAFAGFFPYDNPQYSCIVVIDKPRKNGTSAGGVSGGVFRAIVEEMYSRNMLDCDVNYVPIEGDKTPPRHNVSYEADEVIYDYLAQYPMPDTSAVEADTVAVAMPDAATVPSVIGYTPTEALYELEKLGFDVEMTGTGRVAKQSIKPGIPLQQGMQMKLTLK